MQLQSRSERENFVKSILRERNIGKMAFLLTSWAVVTLVTSVSAAYKGIPAGDHVDTRRAEIGRDYRDELSRDSMIHFVYPIQDLSEF